VLAASLSRSRSAGFTLTELMLAIVVMGVLVATGLPSFTQMLRNSQVRAAAESIANGIQRARAEAVANNTRVRFVLGTGTSWSVLTAAGATLDSRASNEGSVNATLTAVASDLATAATTITFNQLGQVVANADASQALSRVTVVATSANLTLRVTVGAGGNSRVCDPSLPSYPTNMRGC